MSESITLIPFARLVESSTNPRKIFAAGAMAELVESIKSQGVLQPIVVRPLIQQLQGMETDGAEAFEVVFGHRRFRAAQQTDVGEMPCIVRAMSDQDVALAQIHENLERADVSPLEEADGYVRLMRDHGISADQIAADTGKSRTYIYNRIKLAQLSEPARAQVITLQIPAEIATLIARVPAPLQGKAIDRVTSKDYDTGQRVVASYRQARAALAAHFTVALSQVAWDPADDSLTTCGACTSCPKLSSNDPGLAEALGAGVCTDVPCHDAKALAHQARTLDALRHAGRIIDGEVADAIASISPARPPTGYQFVSAVLYPAPGEMRRAESPPARSLTGMLADLAAAGQPLPDTIHIEHHGQLVECLSDSDTYSWLIPDWRRLNGLAISPALSGGTPAPAASTATAGSAEQAYAPRHPDRAHWSAQERAVADGTRWAEIKGQIMQRVATAARTTDDLRLMIYREIDLGTPINRAAMLLGWITQQDIEECNVETIVLSHIDEQAGPDALAAFLLLVHIDDDMGSPHSQRGAACRLALATRYGVDVDVSTSQEDDEAPERDPNTADMFEAA